MDLGMDSNRSIDHLHPNRNHSYIARSRENSFHIKPDKAEPRRAHLR